MATDPHNGQTLLRDTRNLLAFLRDIGIEEIPATDGVRQFLRGRPTCPTTTPAGPRPSAAAMADPAPRALPEVGNATLDELRADLGDCRRCPRHESRRSIVFGQGPANARLLIVGDAPDPDEDRCGEPFAGKPGELLDRMLAAIKLSRDQVYLVNIIKCRSGDETQPTAEAIAACLPLLLRQIAIVGPQLLCAMGPLASQTLLHTRQPLFRLRGRFHDFRGIPLMPTFHPAYLLKNEEMKKASWHDLQMIQKMYDAPAR